MSYYPSQFTIIKFRHHPYLAHCVNFQTLGFIVLSDSLWTKKTTLLKTQNQQHIHVTHSYDSLQRNTSGTQQAELGGSQMPGVHGMIPGWWHSPTRHHQHLTWKSASQLKRYKISANYQGQQEMATSLYWENNINYANMTSKDNNHLSWWAPRMTIWSFAASEPLILTI